MKIRPSTFRNIAGRRTNNFGEIEVVLNIDFQSHLRYDFTLWL